MDTLVPIYSYVKRRKQNVKINKIESLLKILVSRVLQGLILGPILFSLFMNELYLFIKKDHFANIAHNTTRYAAFKDIATLLVIIKSELEEAINCFETNHMFANPDHFQAFVVHRNKNINGNCNLKVNRIGIECKNSVNLLGIEIDNKLLFH